MLCRCIMSSFPPERSKALVAGGYCEPGSGLVLPLHCFMAETTWRKAIGWAEMFGRMTC
jgi:hypothetical protein